jgi:hypothetical protein
VAPADQTRRRAGSDQGTWGHSTSQSAHCLHAEHLLDAPRRPAHSSKQPQAAVAVPLVPRQHTAICSAHPEGWLVVFGALDFEGHAPEGNAIQLQSRRRVAGVTAQRQVWEEWVVGVVEVCGKAADRRYGTEHLSC